MTCPAHLGDETGLCCTRTDEHVAGHVYVSSSGSHVPDRHDKPGRGDGE